MERGGVVPQFSAAEKGNFPVKAELKKMRKRGVFIRGGTSCQILDEGGGVSGRKIRKAEGPSDEV